MEMKVRKGAKVSYEGVYGESIVGVVVGFGGSTGESPLVMSSGEFVRGWMHNGNDLNLYETVGGIQIRLPMQGELYWYVPEENLKVLGYE